MGCGGSSSVQIAPSGMDPCRSQSLKSHFEAPCGRSSEPVRFLKKPSRFFSRAHLTEHMFKRAWDNSESDKHSGASKSLSPQRRKECITVRSSHLCGSIDDNPPVPDAGAEAFCIDESFILDEPEWTQQLRASMEQPRCSLGVSMKRVPVKDLREL